MAGVLKDTYGQVNQAVAGTNVSIQGTTTAIRSATTATAQLNQGVGSTSKIVTLADGTITQITENLKKGAVEAPKLGQGIKTGFDAATLAANTLNTAIAGMTENTRALVQQALAVKEAFRQGATSFQGSATGLGGNIQTAAKGADGIIGSVGGQTVAGKQAEALAAGLEGFGKGAFIFNAKAKEIRDAGLISSQKVNINGASFDYDEAGALFGRAASKELNGLVAKSAQAELALKIAVAQTGSVVAGSNAAEITAQTARIQRQKLTGKLESIPIDFISGFAGGTRGKPIKSGIAMVGEAGPELINVTPAGTHVLSNSDSAKFVGGFAEGTGNLSDFIEASKIKLEDVLDNQLRESNNRNSGSGFSAASFNQFASAQGQVIGIKQTLQIIAEQLKAGNLESAKAILGRAEKFAFINDLGIYKNDVVRALGLLSNFTNLKAPSFAKGLTSPCLESAGILY